MFIHCRIMLHRGVTLNIQTGMDLLGGRVAHMTDTTRQSAPENPPPLPDHAGSIPVYKDNLKNRIAKNNKVLSTILCTIIVFIIPLLMCQDFEWGIPFNIGNPPY